jgi:hypothetical protein
MGQDAGLYDTSPSKLTVTGCAPNHPDSDLQVKLRGGQEQVWVPLEIMIALLARKDVACRCRPAFADVEVIDWVRTFLTKVIHLPHVIHWTYYMYTFSFMRLLGSASTKSAIML